MPLLRTLAVWLLIVATEVLHGTLRVLLLQPWLGDLRSRQLGVVTGSLLIVGVALLTAPWLRTAGTGRLLGIGLLWAALMIGFEIALGRTLGYGWQRILADYDPRAGGFMALGIVVLTLAPLIAARLRGVGRARSAQDR